MDLHEPASQSLDDRILTLTDLAKAIKQTIGKEGMEDEAAKAMAGHVLNFFGNSDYLLDNILEPEYRDVFYSLEEVGLLKTEREETILYDGKDWRIHYWRLNKRKILELARQAETLSAKEENPYDGLPDEMWERKNPGGANASASA